MKRRRTLVQMGRGDTTWEEHKGIFGGDERVPHIDGVIWVFIFVKIY